MKEDVYMQRCVELALKGAGHVAPNPLVGAVLVYKDRIIGEGWHPEYGKAHAEVNCIASVKTEDVQFIKDSVLYVSLEPCAHFGKTPPCTDLIIQQQINEVVIGCRDPFIQVNGKGIEKLKEAGVRVTISNMEDACKKLNKRFFTFHIQHRPYIILKWAQTANQKISASTDQRLLISNEYSNRLVHQWRSEEASILVGTNTALNDNPSLTTRLWPGNSPIRLVIDGQLKLPSSLHLFDGKTKTIVFNLIKHQEAGNVLYYQVGADASLADQVIHALYQLNIQSVMIEGGAQLLQSFIDAGMWDEARIITNTSVQVEKGLSSPILSNSIQVEEQMLSSDLIQVFKPAV